MLSLRWYIARVRALDAAYSMAGYLRTAAGHLASAPRLSAAVLVGIATTLRLALAARFIEYASTHLDDDVTDIEIHLHPWLRLDHLDLNDTSED